MENVLLDRSSRSLEFPRRPLVARSRRGPAGARPPAAPGRGSYAYSSFPLWQPYNHQHKGGGGAWTSAPALPYARPPPVMYSPPPPSLPLLPSNQPPLLPLPPTATKYAAFPGQPAAPPPPAPRAAGRVAAVTTTTAVPAAAPALAPARQRDRRRRPARPPPTTMESTAEKRMKKPLERATPLPPAPAVTEALDDLEQEVARNFVQDLLHVLAPPPSSLPLPSFSLVARGARVVAVPPPAPSCNAEAAAADGIRGLLRL